MQRFILALGLALLQLIPLAGDQPQGHVAVAADHLGQALHYHVGPQLQGSR